MSIVTVSRGSYSRGKEIAEKLARTMGYACISREILLEASEQFNIPEAKLARAIHDAPSLFDRFAFGRERYIAYIRAAILSHVQSDNIVYHGLAGHFFLQGIPHVLKVRIIADWEDRIREEVKREGISAEEAQAILAKDDEERRKWSLHLHGIDTRDSRLYDMVLHIGTLTTGDAIILLEESLRRDSFRTTPASQRILSNRALEAQVVAALISDFPRVKASADSGRVVVSIHTSLGREKEVVEKATRMSEGLAGVEHVDVYAVAMLTPD